MTTNSTSFLYLFKTLLKRVEQFESKIPLGTQLYPQIATIIAVNDPQNKGRVKVTYDNAPSEVSEWIEIAGYHSGNLPAQYLGARMVAVFLNGNPEDAVLLGTLLTDLDTPLKSQPTVVPTFDEQASQELPECSAANEGMLMLFSNTVSSDLKVCLRRNSVTADETDPKKLSSVFSWKSLSHSLQILKGEYGQELPDTSIRKGVQKCSSSLEGERRLFSEDRLLRQVEMVCKKMPGGDYAWINSNSPSVYVRTLLPPCTELSHGLEVVLDDGYNSELAICLRRKKEMKWMTASMRELSFFPEEPLPETEVPEISKNTEAILPEGFISEGIPLALPDTESSGNSETIKNIINIVKNLLT
jgi:hypothetical protein